MRSTLVPSTKPRYQHDLAAYHLSDSYGCHKDLDHCQALRVETWLEKEKIVRCFIVHPCKTFVDGLNQTNVPLKYCMLAAFLILILFAFNPWDVLGVDHAKTNQFSEDTISIKEVVAKVQKELMESEISRRNERREELFVVQSFDLEINFVVRSKMSAAGKADLKLATVDSKHEYSAEKVQKIKLHMAVKPPSENTVGPSSPEQIDFGEVQTHGPVPPSKDPEK